MFLQFGGFLAVHVPLQIEVVFYGQDVLFDFAYLFLQGRIAFFGNLTIIRDLFASLPDVLVEVRYHPLNVFAQTIDVVILNFHLTRYSLFEGGYIFEHFTAFFHPQIQNFELVFNVFVFLLNLSAQLLNQFSMLHELFVHTGKHPPLKNFRVVRYHQRNLLDSQLVFGLVSLELVNKG